MKTLRFILGDQLTRSLSALADLDIDNDIILMVEVRDEATYVKHHKQKLVFVLSAMRHFAQALRDEGMTVDYVRLDSAENTYSFTNELTRALQRHAVDRIVVTEPGEWRVWEMMLTWQTAFDIPVEIRDDDRFLCSRRAFAAWAKGRKSLRMEFFYRVMRRKTGWLMAVDGKPVGDRWNYDAENRKKLPKSVVVPPRDRFAPDATTQEVMALVGRLFPDHFGDLDSFGWAVTRPDALRALDTFLHVYLHRFGDYQDAMKTGEDWLFHSVISPYLNVGLLTAREVCEAVLHEYETAAETPPLAAVEGFIRQILGWREYVRGIYWLKMPEYEQTNYFEATRDLPEFFWSAETPLKCLHETIDATRRNAYAHHIQRLMITGNFALLAGLDPKQVEEWYLLVYADAFDWVELPNTHGMVLHADGGLLGSKPYAASGAYINRMSDYCKGCKFSPKIKLGPGACPFNYLYWYFLIVNEEKLKGNPRMGMPYRNLAKMAVERRQQIVVEAEAFLRTL